MKTYRIRWTYRLERNVKARSKNEALQICEEMGDIDADTRYIPMRVIKTFEGDQQMIQNIQCKKCKGLHYDYHQHCVICGFNEDNNLGFYDWYVVLE